MTPITQAEPCPKCGGIVRLEKQNLSPRHWFECGRCGFHIIASAECWDEVSRLVARARDQARRLQGEPAMTITQADRDAARKTAILQRELDITNADHIALWLEASRPLDNALSWLACRIIEAHEIEVAKAVKAAEARAREEGAKAMQEAFAPLLQYEGHHVYCGHAKDQAKPCVCGLLAAQDKARAALDPAQIAGGGK